MYDHTVEPDFRHRALYTGLKWTLSVISVVVTTGLVLILELGH